MFRDYLVKLQYYYFDSVILRVLEIAIVLITIASFKKYYHLKSEYGIIQK